VAFGPVFLGGHWSSEPCRVVTFPNLHLMIQMTLPSFLCSFMVIMGRFGFKSVSSMNYASFFI
jgi:hypothetical protein